MPTDKEFLTAAFVALSKIQRVKSTTQPDEGSMADLEKALSTLSAFSLGDERSLVDGWRAQLNGLRQEVQRHVKEIQGRTRELSELAETDIAALVISRVPEGEYRAKVEAELGKLLSGTGPRTLEVEPLGGPEQSSASELERKLELVESEASSSGLERFLPAARKEDPPG